MVSMLTVLSASASDLEPPFSDPLQTLPKIIETGAVLPSDTRKVPCPGNKNIDLPLDLSEAVDLALCNNPQIKTTWATIKIQAGLVGEARAAYLPSISLTTSRMETRRIYPGLNTSTTETYGQTMYGTLSWRLFDFGGRAANRRSANSLLAAAIAMHDASLQKVLATVVQSYFNAQSSKAMLLSKEQLEVIARKILESAQRREDRGEVSHSDTLQAMTALAKATLDKSRAVGDYQKSLSVLVYVIGISQQTQIILSNDNRDKVVVEVKDLSSWLDIAKKSHPAIAAAQAQLESAKQIIISTRAEGLPTVDMSANYYKNGYPGQGLLSTPANVNTLGISVTIPLFEGLARTYKIRGAKAKAEQKEAELQDTENNILMEVVKAYADAVSSLQNLHASETLFSVAQESLNTSQRKYNNGAADILEILHAQAALADAQFERIRCIAEWRSARLNLLANAGMMGREVVLP